MRPAQIHAIRRHFLRSMPSLLCDGMQCSQKHPTALPYHPVSCLVDLIMLRGCYLADWASDLMRVLEHIRMPKVLVE